jgi:gliding motility-associated-like protein
MKKTYPLHFLSLRKCFNRIAVLSVLVFVCTALSVNAQSVPAKPAVVFPHQQVAGNAGNVQKGTQPAEAKGVIKNSSGNEGEGRGKPQLKSKWIAHPFDHKVFVENKGQFNADVDNSQKVLFQASLGGTMKAYFLPNGVFFKETKFVRDSTADESDDDKIGEKDDLDSKHIGIVHTVSSIWEGANTNVAIVAGEEQSYPETFSIREGGRLRSISTNLFKTITYKNIYPGIDIEYMFPDGDKTGLKYTVIVHPGADLSQVKLNYTGPSSLHIEQTGDVTVKNEIWDFTDHAPVSSYQEGGTTNVVYKINGSTETFEVKGEYDKTKTLVIDPWTYTGTFGFTNYGSIYDLDYDDYGNVYAAGDFYPYQVVKFNSGGGIVWLHAAFTYDNTNSGYDQTIYGGFAVDKHSSVAYICQGYNTAGSDGEKLDPANGSVLAYLTGTSDFQEIWRMEFNACTGQIALGGGGTNSPSAQVAVLDTTMATVNPQNPLGTPSAGHDVAAMALDPVGSTCYMQFVSSTFDGSYNNSLMSVPMPSLNPANYITGGDGFGFVECSSVRYVGPGNDCCGFGGKTTNAMNGMAASPGWLYIYDGRTLAQYVKGSGAYNNSINTGGSQYRTAGLAADGCDNIYVGVGTNIGIYNSALSNITTTGVSGTVYSLRLGLNDASLFVGGAGFVQEFSNPFASVVATATLGSNTTCGLNNGSATAGLSLCSGPASGVTYKWMPGGQTGQTATNLGPGTYTVTMSVGCGDKYTATVTIGGSTAPSLTISASPSSTICSGTSTTLNAGGGGSNYTWSTGANTTSITVSPTVNTTYTLTDADCPTYTTSITVDVNTTPAVSAIGSNSPICAGQTLNLTSTGTAGSTYTWTGPNGFTSSSQNPSIAGATTLASGTYSLTVSKSGCTSAVSTVVVTVNALPATPVLSSNSPICAGSTLTLGTTSGGPTYTWTGPNSFTSGVQNPTIAGATTAASGTYSLVVTSGAGCGSALATIAVTVNPLPAATVASSNSPICAGQTLNLNSTATTGTSFHWTGPNSFTSGVQNPSIAGATTAASGTYTVTTTSAAGCTSPNATVTVVVNPLPVTPVLSTNSPICAGSTLTLGTTSGGPTYTWTGPNGFTSGVQNPSIAGASTLASGTYSLTVTSGAGCASAVATIAVTVNALPTAPTLGSNSPVCSGGAINLTTTSGGPTYTWTGPNSFTSGVQNPTIAGATVAASGTYSLTVTAGGGCTSPMSTISVVVNQTPAATVAGSNSPICAGATLNLTSTATTGTTYNWTGPNGFTSTSQNPSIAGATTAASGTYTVTTTSAAGCKSANATVTVVVNPIPVAPTLGSNSPICAGSNLNLTASAAGATSYSWTGPNSFTSGVQNPTITAATVAATGTYTVTASAAGCTSPTATIVVKINPTPTISVAPLSPTICPGGNVTLTGTVLGTGPATYLWTPSGATTSTLNVSPASTTTYTLTGTSAGCPGPPATVVVTVANSLNITVTATPTAICTGTSSVLNATGAATFTWRPATGLTCTACPNPTANPGSTTTYTIVGKSGACSDSTNFVLTVNPTPTLSIGISGIAAAICPGDSMQLTGGGLGAGGSYVWTPGTGVDCSTCSVTYVKPGSTTTYTLTGTQATGCTSTATQVITVYPQPVITISASSSTLCSGDTATLTASGVTTYNWLPNDSLSSTTGSVVMVWPTTSTTYTVSGKGTGGCKTKDSIAITINPTPTVTVTPPNPAVCPGGSIPMTASGASTYAWLPGTGLNVTTGASVTGTPGTTTTYSVVGTSTLGCRDTATVVLTINPRATITVTPPTPAVCSGDSVNLISGGAGVGGTYTWSPATSLNNTNTDSVWAKPAGTITYTVTGISALGCTGDTTVTIAVGTLTVTANAVKSTICSGTSTKLTGGGASNFTWKPSTGLNATTGSVVTATPTVTTTYTVVGTSGGAGNCSDSAQVVVTVNTTPTVSVTAASPFLCFGGKGDTIKVTGGDTYTWKPATGIVNVSGDSVVVAKGTVSQTYTVTGTSALGCPATATVNIAVDKVVVIASASSSSICFGTSTNIAANGAANYVWSPSVGLNVTTGTPVTATPDSSLTYKVVGTDAKGCADSANVPITVNPTPTITVNAVNTNLCIGNSTVITAGGASTYAWTPSIGLVPTVGSSVTATPPGTETYTVTGKSASGCIGTGTITVNVNPTPTVSIGLSNGNTVCPGQPFTMTGSGATNYTWSPATGLNPSTGSVVTATLTTGTITYKVVGVNGTCSDSATANINVYPPLVVTSSSNITCAGKQSTISVSASGGDPGYTYSWSNGVTGTGPGPYGVNPASTTTYSCQVTDACGSTATGADTVFVLPTPIGSKIWATPDTIMGGQFVAFVDTSSNVTSWYWTFGDGGTSVDSFPYYQYVVQGVYPVTLVISNPSGCADTLYDTVYVKEGIYVPNVFTPNNDGVNDVFHVTAGSLKTYSIEIFNRWGEKLFTANSPNDDWDGRSMSGVEEADGAYFWIIKATDYAGQTYNLKGYLQLIRN